MHDRPDEGLDGAVICGQAVSFIIAPWPAEPARSRPLFVRQKGLYLGGSPIWQMFRVTYQASKALSGGWSRLVAAIGGGHKRVRRPVSDELMHFTGGQMKKLKAIFRTLLRFKKCQRLQRGCRAKMARIRKNRG